MHLKTEMSITAGEISQLDLGYHLKKMNCLTEQLHCLDFQNKNTATEDV